MTKGASKVLKSAGRQDACARLSPPHPRRIVRHGPTGLTTRCQLCGATLTPRPAPRLTRAPVPVAVPVVTERLRAREPRQTAAVSR